MQSRSGQQHEGQVVQEHCWMTELRCEQWGKSVIASGKGYGEADFCGEIGG